MRLVSLGTKRRRLAALAIGAVGLAAAVVLPALPASAATACNVVYKVDNQWQGAFQGSIAITNTGDAWTSWTLRFSYANGQTITQLWNGLASQAGAAVTVNNQSYNGNVGTGSSVTPGFLANWSGTNSLPTAFSVNNVACNGGVTPTSAATTGSTPTRTPTASPTASRSAAPTSSTVPTSGAPCSTNCPAHVDNPYAGATGYNNTEIGQVITLAYLDAYTRLVDQLGGLPGPGGASAANAQQMVVATRATSMFTQPSTRSQILRPVDSGMRLYPTGNKNGLMWEVKDELGNQGWVSSIMFELAK